MSNSIKTRPLRAGNAGNSGLKSQWPALASLSEGEIGFLTAKTQVEFQNMKFENRFEKHVHGGLFSPRSTEGRELWEKYWPLIASSWVKKHPGTRPAAFWFHGVADRDSADYFDLRERASWPKKKQAAYLKRHNLLTAPERP